MSALYAMRYLGGSGVGFGAIYIGRGVILGFDVTNARIAGDYVEEGGRIKARLVLTATVDANLVTGQHVTAGTTIPITLDWPTDFASGVPQQVTVAGRPVTVTMERIGDIP